MTYDKITIDTFLKKQNQLFDEIVAENEREAQEFLDDVMAFVAKDYSEVREYFQDETDISGMSKEDILDQSEVFAIPDGRYLIVEG